MFQENAIEFGTVEPTMNPAVPIVALLAKILTKWLDVFLGEVLPSMQVFGGR